MKSIKKVSQEYHDTAISKKSKEIAKLREERDVQSTLRQLADGKILLLESMLASERSALASARAALAVERERALMDCRRHIVECGREWQTNGHCPTHDDYLRQIEHFARRAAEAKESK